MATTPRRTLTTDEKRARDEQYRVEPKQFGEILKGLVAIFNSLSLLNNALGQAGKGAHLAWPHPTQPGQFIIFNRRDLRSANSKFTRTLLDLKNYLRVSRKKPRAHVNPESFSGVYTPVYAGDALQRFFNAAPGNFGPLDPAAAVRTGVAGQGLMDQLPMAKQGYLLRNTSTMLFYIYAHAQQLQAADNAQFAKSDAVMTEAFGGQIPAAFYSYPIGDDKAAKVTMTEAVAQGLIPAPMNTYQVIAALHPPGVDANGKEVGFRPERFNTYFFQNIAAANYYSRTALAADPALAPAAAGLQQADIRAAMLNEHNIVKNVSAQWHDLLEPGRKQVRDERKKVADANKRGGGRGGRGGRGARV